MLAVFFTVYLHALGHYTFWRTSTDLKIWSSEFEFKFCHIISEVVSILEKRKNILPYKPASHIEFCADLKNKVLYILEKRKVKQSPGYSSFGTIKYHTGVHDYSNLSNKELVHFVWTYKIILKS